MRRIAAFGLLLLLSGCLVGPDYERPPPATPLTPDYKETSDSLFRPAQPRDTVDRGPWWDIYSDPTLTQLVAQVEVSNQNLKASEAAYRQAVALIRQSQSALYPTFGYTGGVQQTGAGTSSGRTATVSGTSSPPMIEMPSGWRSSAPSPKPSASGSAPSIAAMVVIRIGRKRSTAA